MRGEKLSIQEETRIVALLARGDKPGAILADMEKAGRNIEYSTLRAVRKRNAETLQRIQAAVLKIQVEDAGVLRGKANTAIGQELDQATQNAAILNKAGSDYLHGIITLKEYTEIAKQMKKASLTELVAVSKEMHTQATKGDDPSLPAGEGAAIQAAMEAGDEVEMTRLLFRKNPAPNANGG